MSPENSFLRRGLMAAQSTLEYAVLLVCIVAALIAMRIYFKRAISGHLRQAGDEIGQQYDPRHTSNPRDVNTNSSGMFKSISRDVTREISFKTFREAGRSELNTTVERKETINREESKEWGIEQVDAMEKDKL